MESMIQPLATESKIIEEFQEEINELHDEINNFLYKISLIQFNLVLMLIHRNQKHE